MHLEHQPPQQAQDLNCGAGDLPALGGWVWRRAGHEEELWVCLWRWWWWGGFLQELGVERFFSVRPCQGQPPPSPPTRRVRPTSGPSPSPLDPDASGSTSSPTRSTAPGASRSPTSPTTVCEHSITFVRLPPGSFQLRLTSFLDLCSDGFLFPLWKCEIVSF